MNEENLRKECGLFKVGKCNVHEDEGSRLLSLVTDDLK